MMDGTTIKYPPLSHRKSISPTKSASTSLSPIKSGTYHDNGIHSINRTDIDYNLLDYKQPNDFINKYYIKGDERNLLEQITTQLKITRNLLQLSTITMNNSTPGNQENSIQNIIDCSQVIIDAEKIVFANIDTNGDLLIQGPNELIRVTSGIEHDTIKSQKGIIINEVSSDTRVNLDVYRPLQIIPRNIICYPVINSNSTTMGILLVINKLSINAMFSSFDLWCLEYISSYIATALLLKRVNFQDHSNHNEKNHKISVENNNLNLNIQSNSSSLSYTNKPPPFNPYSSSSLPPPKIKQSSTIELCIEQLINNAYHILQADKISLFLPNESSTQLICTISRDIKGMQVSMDEGVVGQTLKSKSPIHSSNVRENIHHSNSMDNLTGYNTVSLLSFPIISKNGNHVLGVLQAINKKGGEGDFTVEDNIYFSNLSTYISELLTNQGDSHMESMNLNIMKAIGDYSYASAYNYRSHIYDSLEEFNEIRIQELISYCKLICSTDQVLMYSLQSNSAVIALTTQYENEIFAQQSENIGLELKYLESLSKNDSNSIANPSSGEYGSVYSMPSYRQNNIPSSVLRAIKQNRIIQITKNRTNTNTTNTNINSFENDLSDQNYLQSVNSTAAIIIPIHLVTQLSSESTSSSQPLPHHRENESPIDVFIILKTIPQAASSPSTSSSSSSSATPFTSKDSHPTYASLFNLSLYDFTIYQSNGIQCLLKIFHCTYQLSLAHREELFQQSILENKVQIMNDTLIQLDTMYCLLSGDGLLKLYNPSFEEFLGISNEYLESLSQSQSQPDYHLQSSTNEYKLMDINLNLLFPMNSSPLMESFQESIRSGKVIHQKDVLLKTFKYPNGIRMNYEIYEYYGHHIQQNFIKSGLPNTPTATKKRVKKSLSKLESFHFDNYSSPLQERKFTGRTGKLYRVCLKYVDEGSLQHVIQSNSQTIHDIPLPLNENTLQLQQNEDLDCLVLQTKNTILLTPQKHLNQSVVATHQLGGYSSSSSSPLAANVTPTTPAASYKVPPSPRMTLSTPNSTSKLSQLPLLFTWDFNSLEVSSPEHQKQYSILLFEKNINITDMNIPKAIFHSLISDIELNYYSNPFHNFQHALCVLQFLYMLLEVTNFPPSHSPSPSHASSASSSHASSSASSHASHASYHHLIPHDYLYLSVLLSGLFHDLRHPGNTNLFEIHSQSSRALLYNDQSVLENYHCSTAFHLLNLQKNNIFIHFTFQEKFLIRKMIISCILATDMSQHNLLIDQMNDKRRVYATEIAQQDYLSIIQKKDEEMIFFCKILLHCADLSNPVRPFPISKRWAELVSEEFNEQGKKEVFLDLPVSTFLLSPTLESLVKNEIYFCNEIVLPLWKSLELYFPCSNEFHQFVQQIHQNTLLWKEQLSSPSTAVSFSSTATSLATPLATPPHTPIGNSKNEISHN